MIRKYAVPNTNPEYSLSPAHSDEAGLFYALTPEQDEQLGVIGHLRIDFGKDGKEWWSTWHPRGKQELNTPEFRAELDELVNELRKDGLPLHNLADMRRYCQSHGGDIEGGWNQNYGYQVETERYLYRIRCNPSPGDYQCYLTCFDKNRQELMQDKTLIGKLTFADGSILKYHDSGEFLQALKEELPYIATTGLRFTVLTDDPQVRKAVDDQLYDLFGEENPRPIEDYAISDRDTPEMTM